MSVGCLFQVLGKVCYFLTRWLGPIRPLTNSNFKGGIKITLNDLNYILDNLWIDKDNIREGSKDRSFFTVKKKN